MKNTWLLEKRVKELEAENKALKEKIEGKKKPSLARGTIHLWRSKVRKDQAWFFDWQCFEGEQGYEELRSILISDFTDLVFGCEMRTLIEKSLNLDRELISCVGPCLLTEFKGVRFWYDVLYPKNQILFKGEDNNKTLQVIGL